MKKTGDEYYDSEEFHDLLNEYEQAVNTGEPVFMDADELAEIADYYQITGNDELADKAITLALSLSPGAIAPLTYKIHEALYNGDTEMARVYLNQIVEKEEPDYVYNQAEILIAEGRIDEADLYLRDELKKLPPEECQDFVVDVAYIFTDYGISEKAMEWMGRAMPEDTPEFKELMARTLFGLGKYKDSEKLFNELIDDNPFSKYYWNALASAQFMNEDYSNSIQSSEFAIAIDPNDADSIFAKANALYHLDNYEKANEYYQRYLELVPDDEHGMLHKGTCLINMGRIDEAVNVLTKARELAEEVDDEGNTSPSLCEIYTELGFAFNEQGKTDEALHCLGLADTLDCDHSQIEVVKGHVLLSAGRLKEADECFSMAVENSSDKHLTIMRIAVSYFDNKHMETTYDILSTLYKTTPPDYKLGFAYMALCCLEMKKYDEFLAYLKIACQRNPMECKQVLHHMFPADLDPVKYYDYVYSQLKK